MHSSRHPLTPGNKTLRTGSGPAVTHFSDPLPASDGFSGDMDEFDSWAPRRRPVGLIIAGLLLATGLAVAIYVAISGVPEGLWPENVEKPEIIDEAINAVASPELARKAGETLNDVKSQLISRVRDVFAGLPEDAVVNELTGEVFVRFKDLSFGAGRARLNRPMREKLARVFPRYAKALFADPELAAKIESVEIIGFASPTYRKKYVAPTSLTVAGRKALFYNMDLSYSRARSVYRFVYDQARLQFPHQTEIFRKTRVSGRGYLDGVENTAGPTASMKRYCSQHDCAGQQIVALRFYLK